MLEELKKKVYLANQELNKSGLVILTWGNVSERDPKTGLVVIKPSGVDYDKMNENDMVVVDINGKVVEGGLNPSSDTPTHLEIYREHPEVMGICHTHSFFATAWAQSMKPLKCLGTTHADYFYGDVPVTRVLSEKEVNEAYELNTGKAINEVLNKENALLVPAVFVANHGPFTFGKDGMRAVENAVVLDYLCGLALNSYSLNEKLTEMNKYILDKHYFRKHGSKAYYGQKEKK